MTGVLPFLFALLLLPNPELSKATVFEGEVPVVTQRTVVQDEDGLDGADVGGEVETTAALSGAGEAMRIVSRRSDFDRNENLAYFEGDVVVNYFPDYRLDCDRLFVFFKNREFDRMIALGHVAVSNDTRFGFCDRATFLRQESEIELFGGKSESRATLIETGSNVIKGGRIKFWINTDQVEISDSEITVNKGKEEVKSL